jgi:hypothetical protein
MNAEQKHTAPGQPKQPTAEEVERFEAFAERLATEYEGQMYAEVAAAANACETNVVTKEDITRMAPFISGMIVRLFALGVAAMAADFAKQALAAERARDSHTVILQ